MSSGLWQSGIHFVLLLTLTFTILSSFLSLSDLWVMSRRYEEGLSNERPDPFFRVRGKGLMRVLMQALMTVQRPLASG